MVQTDRGFRYTPPDKGASGENAKRLAEATKTFKPKVNHAAWCPVREMPPGLLQSGSGPQATCRGFALHCTCSQSATGRSLRKLQARGFDARPKDAEGGTMDRVEQSVGRNAEQAATLTPSSAQHEATMDRSIMRSFRRFHAGNPQVYDLLVNLAREAGRRGKRVGIGLLWERMRWEIVMETTGEEPKFNNNYRAHYARLIMKQEPDLADYFKTRHLRSV